VSASTEDGLIGALIVAAREIAENETGRSLISQTWKKTLDAFPRGIVLPYPPALAVTHIKYTDLDGVLQTLAPASYTLDKEQEPGWITPAYGYAWPDVRAVVNAIEVVYTAGYGEDAGSVPQAIKQWILLTVGHHFENREASVAGVSIAPLPFLAGLLDPYRILAVI